MLNASAYSQELLGSELERLRRTHFVRLIFPTALEDRFERDTAKGRSDRLWLEGLLAILALNVCLLMDLIFVRDVQLQSVVVRTLLVTPLALFVNSLMRRDLEQWVREGSVAIGATLICLINMHAEGNATAAASTYALMCVLIMVLFTGVVMRIRLPYAVAAILAMTLAGLTFLIRAGGLQSSEKIVGASLLLIGTVITLTATYSLEREERLAYLFSLRSAAQTEELAAANAELLQLSNLDKLTGLLNRRAFDERFEALWLEGERLQQPLSVIMIDVDHFQSPQRCLRPRVRRHRPAARRCPSAAGPPRSSGPDRTLRWRGVHRSPPQYRIADRAPRRRADTVSGRRRRHTRLRTP